MQSFACILLEDIIHYKTILIGINNIVGLKNTRRYLNSPNIIIIISKQMYNFVINTNIRILMNCMIVY